MKTTRRILGMLLCLAMVIGFIPAFTLSAQAADGTWTLVTNVNDLAAGDQVIIASAGYNYALSTTQNNNNRGQAGITKNGDTVTLGDGVQVLTLEAGNVSGTFAFNTGNGYLYAASSSSNYLKTETKLSNNSSWKITIAGDGVATIVAQGDKSRNTMQYNYQSSLFACYSSASQKPICLYKLVKNTTPDTPSCDHATDKLTPDWDENQHWYVCSCGKYTTTPADHDFTTNDTCECGFEKPAVPEGKTYAKYTASTLVTGEYILVTAKGYAPGVVDGTWISAIQPEKSGENYTNAKGGAWTVTVTNGNVVELKDANGVVVGPKEKGIETGAGKKWKAVSGTTVGTFKFTSEDGEFFLSSNHGQSYKFRAYADKSSDNGYSQLFTLYKLVEATPEQPPVPAFDSASLVLQNNLAVQFNVPVSRFDNTGYSEPYAVFNFDGKDYTVTEKTETTDSEGTAVYAFTFKNIAPHKAGKPISYTLKSTYDGEEVSSESGTYSVLTYCQNKLDGTDTKLKTLVSDLLNYCAAVQASLGETELITDGVTGMTPTTDDVTLTPCKAVTKNTIENPVAVWDNATLILKDKVIVRFYFDAESIDGLSVKIGGAKNATISEIKREGEYYYVDFTGLMANEMRAQITATVCSGDAAVSETVTYSIESYAAFYQNVEANGMGALVKAMMKYGDSAANY